MCGRSEPHVVRRLRRELRPRRPVPDAARRHLRRLQVQDLQRLAAAQVPLRRPDAVQRARDRDASPRRSRSRIRRPGTPFDIGYKRTDNGGFFEWQGLAPWYFRVDLNQVKFDGTKIGSGANGTSPGNGFTDLIFPTQYNTKNATAEGGYSSGKLTASLSYLYSKFENDFTTFTWNNGFFGSNVDTTYLAPDNNYQRIAANLHVPGLPWHSTFAARYTWSEAKSDATLAQTALNSAGATPFGPTLPNVDTFNGKVQNQTFTAAFASHPAKTVDTRVYYNYYKRNNDSTERDLSSTRS